MSIAPSASGARKRTCSRGCKPARSFMSFWITRPTNKKRARSPNARNDGQGLRMSTGQKTGGLAGVVAGQTAISTVGKQGVGLTYRGYSINDLAERATFEEVAFLLLRGELPTRSELTEYRKKLIALRGLPAPLKTVLEQLPAETNPM